MKEQIEQIVKNEVIYNLNTLLQIASKKEEGFRDLGIEFENYLKLQKTEQFCGVCSNCTMVEEKEEIEKEIEKLENETHLTDEKQNELWDLEEKIEKINEIEKDQIEGNVEEACLTPNVYHAMEYWIVSENLYRDLLALGHPVAEFCDGYLWGRPTTGQDLKADSVFSSVVELRKKRKKALM